MALQRGTGRTSSQWMGDGAPATSHDHGSSWNVVPGCREGHAGDQLSYSWMAMYTKNQSRAAVLMNMARSERPGVMHPGAKKSCAQPAAQPAQRKLRKGLT